MLMTLQLDLKAKFVKLNLRFLFQNASHLCPKVGLVHTSLNFTLEMAFAEEDP